MRRFLICAGIVGAVAASAVPAALAGGRPFSTALSGANEAPGPGDPDGTGHARVTLNQGQGEVCYDFTVANVGPIVAGHIHRAPVGVAGPVVVPFPVATSLSGCVAADPELIKEIRQNPTEFYVNLHPADFPAGAVRGQLGK